MRALLTAIIITMIMSMAGCGVPANKKQAQEQASQDESQIHINTELAGKAKDAAREVKGVKDSAAVVINKEISTAIKVTGFDRLRLKPIKREVHDKVKELDKEHNVFVTTDKKLFVHLQQLERDIDNQQDKSLIDIQKKFNKINRDMLR